MAEIKNNDSIGKTLLVVLVLCLVCSIVVKVVMVNHSLISLVQK